MHFLSTTLKQGLSALSDQGVTTRLYYLHSAKIIINGVRNQLLNPTDPQIDHRPIVFPLKEDNSVSLPCIPKGAKFIEEVSSVCLKCDTLDQVCVMALSTADSTPAVQSLLTRADISTRIHTRSHASSPASARVDSPGLRRSLVTRRTLKPIAPRSQAPAYPGEALAESREALALAPPFPSLPSCTSALHTSASAAPMAPFYREWAMRDARRQTAGEEGERSALQSPPSPSLSASVAAAIASSPVVSAASSSAASSVADADSKPLSASLLTLLSAVAAFYRSVGTANLTLGDLTFGLQAVAQKHAALEAQNIADEFEKIQHEIYREILKAEAEMLGLTNPAVSSAQVEPAATGAQVENTSAHPRETPPSSPPSAAPLQVIGNLSLGVSVGPHGRNMVLSFRRRTGASDVLRAALTGDSDRLWRKFWIEMRGRASPPPIPFLGPALDLSRREALELLQAVEMAHGAYKPTLEALAATTSLKKTDLRVFQPMSSRLQPAYFIAVDHTNKRIVWSVRGTQLMLDDLLLDLAAVAHPLAGGSAHWGMTHAAHWLLDKEAGRVAGMLRVLRDYNLLLVGHSMGAGVAALMALLINKDPRISSKIPPARVTCITLATPCVMSSSLALDCRPYVTSLVMSDDIVPRLNTTSLTRLRDELVMSDWRGQLGEAFSRAQTLQELVAGLPASVSSLLPAPPAFMSPGSGFPWASTTVGDDGAAGLSTNDGLASSPSSAFFSASTSACVGGNGARDDIPASGWSWSPPRYTASSSASSAYSVAPPRLSKLPGPKEVQVSELFSNTPPAAAGQSTPNKSKAVDSSANTSATASAVSFENNQAKKGISGESGSTGNSLWGRIGGGFGGWISASATAGGSWFTRPSLAPQRRPPGSSGTEVLNGDVNNSSNGNQASFASSISKTSPLPDSNSPSAGASVTSGLPGVKAGTGREPAAVTAFLSDRPSRSGTLDLAKMVSIGKSISAKVAGGEWFRRGALATTAVAAAEIPAQLAAKTTAALEPATSGSYGMEEGKRGAGGPDTADIHAALTSGAAANELEKRSSCRASSDGSCSQVAIPKELLEALDRLRQMPVFCRDGKPSGLAAQEEAQALVQWIKDLSDKSGPVAASLAAAVKPLSDLLNQPFPPSDGSRSRFSQSQDQQQSQGLQSAIRTTPEGNPVFQSGVTASHGSGLSEPPSPVPQGQPMAAVAQGTVMPHEKVQEVLKALAEAVAAARSSLNGTVTAAADETEKSISSALSLPSPGSVMSDSAKAFGDWAISAMLLPQGPLPLVDVPGAIRVSEPGTEGEAQLEMGTALFIPGKVLYLDQVKIPKRSRVLSALQSYRLTHAKTPTSSTTGPTSSSKLQDVDPAAAAVASLAEAVAEHDEFLRRLATLDLEDESPSNANSVVEAYRRGSSPISSVLTGSAANAVSSSLEGSDVESDSEGLGEFGTSDDEAKADPTGGSKESIDPWTGFEHAEESDGENEDILWIEESSKKLDQLRSRKDGPSSADSLSVPEQARQKSEYAYLSSSGHNADVPAPSGFKGALRSFKRARKDKEKKAEELRAGREAGRGSAAAAGGGGGIFSMAEDSIDTVITLAEGAPGCSFDRISLGTSALLNHRCRSYGKVVADLLWQIDSRG